MVIVFYEATTSDGNGMNMMKTPRYSEFKGYYNVDPRMIEDPNDPPDYSDYLWIQDGLDGPGYHEVDAIADLLEEFHASLGRSERAISYSLGFDDRTAGLFLLHSDLLTVSVMETLQNLLSRRAPLWRFVIPGENEGDTIVIYPSTIAYPTPGDPELIMKSIRESAADEYERTKAVFERQLRYVKRVIKDALPPKGIPYDPVIVAAFDSESGNCDDLCVWLLQDGYAHAGRSWLPDQDLGDGFLGEISLPNSDVTVDGTLAPYMEAGAEFVGELSVWAYSKQDFHGELILVNPATKEQVRRPIPPSSILSDKDVKLFLAKGGNGGRITG